MFDDIRANADLQALLRLTCEENGVGVDIDETLLEKDGYLKDEKIIILKIDDYYNSKKIAIRPKSIDYLILVKCCDDLSYSMYLIELKNTIDKNQLNPKGIIEKFRNTIEDFLNIQFLDIFKSGNYKAIKLFLVSPKKIDNAAKNRSIIFDSFATVRPFKLLGHSVLIQPRMPNPKVEAC